MTNKKKLLKEIEDTIDKRTMPKPKTIVEKPIVEKIPIKKEDTDIKEDIPVIQNNRNKHTSVTDDVKHVLGKDESDYTKVADLLLNEKFYRRKTNLDNNQQVGLLSALDVISQLYDIPFLKRYIDYYGQWLTSIGAKGRQDIVDISKFRFDEQNKINDQLLNLAGRGR